MLDDELNSKSSYVWEFKDKASYDACGKILDKINKENKIIISGVAKEVFENAAKLSSVDNEVGALARFYLGLHAYQNENMLLAITICIFSNIYLRELCCKSTVFYGFKRTQ